MKFLGLALAVIVPGFLFLFTDFGDQPETSSMAAVAAMMAILWITEAVPLAATALLPLFLFPLLGIASTKDTASHYMNSTVFLLIGGFLIALAMQRWELHRRIALGVLARFGNHPFHLTVGFVVATAGLSMWISNTATTLVMLPIALAVLSRFEASLDEKQIKQFSIGLLLAIAYSASIGGMMTPVGTAPNLVFLRLYEMSAGGPMEIGFAQWMLFAVPIGLSMIVIMSAYLGVLYFRNIPRSAEIGRMVTDESKKLGPMGYEEKVVSIVFSVTAMLWISRKGLAIGGLNLPGWQVLFENGVLLDDGAVVIATSFLLFLIPAKAETDKRNTILNEDVFRQLPWPVVVLFGGGFALASGFVDSGLSEFMASQLAGLEKSSLFIMMTLVASGMTFLTELTSNTATTQLVLPILQSVASVMNIPPLWLMLPATISASCAFMLPVATPPNAIIFGSGKLQVIDMVKTGFILNVIGIVVIVSVLTLIVPMLGIQS